MHENWPKGSCGLGVGELFQERAHFLGFSAEKWGVDHWQDTGREEHFFQIQTCLFDSSVGKELGWVWNGVKDPEKQQNTQREEATGKIIKYKT